MTVYKLVTVHSFPEERSIKSCRRHRCERVFAWEKGRTPQPFFPESFGREERPFRNGKRTIYGGVSGGLNMFTFFPESMLFQRQKDVFLAVLIKKNERSKR